MAYGQLAKQGAEQSEWDRAEALFADALNFQSERDPAVRDEVAEIGLQLSRAFLRDKQYERAERAIRTSIRIRETIVKDFPDDFNHQDELRVDISQLSYVLHGSGNLPAALAVINKAIDLSQKIVEEDPDSELFRKNLSQFYLDRGFYYIKAEAQDKSLADYLKAVELAPRNANARYRLAILYLDAGDIPAFRNVSTEMLQQFSTTEDAEAAHWTAWTAILVPGAVSDPSIPLRLAEQALQSDPQSTFQRQTVGAALYRAGRFEEALVPQTDLATHWDQHGVTAEDRTSPAYTYFFLAMTHHRLGHADEAQKWFEKGIHWAEHNEKDPEWNRSITLELFRNEAAQLLGVEIPTNKDQQEEAATGPKTTQ